MNINHKHGTRNRMMYHYESPQLDRGWWPILIITACAVACMAASACQPRDTSGANTFVARNG